MMRSQIFSEVMGSVAFARAMTNHNDFATQRHGGGDPPVIRGLLRRTLTSLPRLILMLEMMQEVMRIVGTDGVFRSLIRHYIDMENLCPMMIDDDQKIWRAWIGMSDSLGRMLG